MLWGRDNTDPKEDLDGKPLSVQKRKEGYFFYLRKKRMTHSLKYEPELQVTMNTYCFTGTLLKNIYILVHSLPPQISR